MVRALLIFAILASQASAEVNYCESGTPPESKLTFFEKAVYYIAHQTHQRANPNEAKYFSKHILSSLKMKDLKILATQQSQILCQPKWMDTTSRRKDTEDNEVDAVRHFILSTLLSYFHPDEVVPILLNHEINGKTPLNKQNFMDMYNNQLGIAYGEELQKNKKKLSKLEVAFLASEKALFLLKKKDLRTLKSMSYGPCKDLPSQKDSVIKKLSFEHQKDYDLNQRSCLGAALDCGIK